MTLIQRLLGKQDIGRRLSFDEAKPFFRAVGINLETIGFPGNETANPCWRDFYNVKMNLVTKDKKPEVIITGKYALQFKCGYQEGGVGGMWHPARQRKYSFTISEGKLELRGKR